MAKFFLARLFEKSTIGVIISLVTGACGLVLAPDAKDVIVGGVVAVLSTIGIIMPEERR